MKKISLFSLLTILVMSCSSEKHDNTVIIKGEVKSGSGNTVIFDNIVDNPILFIGETYTATIDSNSRFSIEIPVQRIAYGSITARGYYHEICLIPGDELYISIDADTILYSGKGAEKNNFLYQCEIDGVWNCYYNEEFNKGELTPNDFLTYINNFKEQKLNFLQKYNDSISLQEDFIEYYKIKTDVIYENLIRTYPNQYSYKNNINLDSINLPEIYNALKSYSNYTDTAKLMIHWYIFNITNDVEHKIFEILSTGKCRSINDARYIALFDSLTGKTKEYVLTAWIVKSFYSIDTYDSVAISEYSKIEKDELSKQAFEIAFNKFNEKRSLIGKPLHTEFSNTLLYDTSGVQLSFEDMMEKYKGKVVYLDIWGMGCGPCRAAMPYAKKLKEKLADLPIEFVYISVDKIEPNEWEKVFDVTLTNKNHYVFENGMGSRLHKFMKNHWVPSYMIFDKEGRLTDYNADRPDERVEQGETELEKTLKELASE